MKRKIKNLDQARDLVEIYNEITPQMIRDAWSVHFPDKDFNGSEIAGNLTGFGEADTCLLCSEISGGQISSLIKTRCGGCIYTVVSNSIERANCCKFEHKKTYDLIYNAFSVETLINAFQARADHIQGILEGLEA